MSDEYLERMADDWKMSNIEFRHGRWNMIRDFSYTYNQAAKFRDNFHARWRSFRKRLVDLGYDTSTLDAHVDEARVTYASEHGLRVKKKSAQFV